MEHLKHNGSKKFKASDIVYTPDHIAKAIIERYKPSGKILEPCMGGGAFSDQIPDCLWCEIAKGKDFFDWKEPVDWIIGNPPYSILTAWLDHSFTIANDIVYLLPIAKIFNSLSRLRSIKNYGGIVEVYAPWTGRAVGFEFGWSCGAVHMRKGYDGKMNLVV